MGGGDQGDGYSKIIIISICVCMCQLMSARRAGGNDGMGLLLCLCNSGTGLLCVYDGPREGLLKPATIKGKIKIWVLGREEEKEKE